jgi:hypothetical protein
MPTRSSKDAGSREIRTVIGVKEHLTRITEEEAGMIMAVSEIKKLRKRQYLVKHLLTI